MIPKTTKQRAVGLPVALLALAVQASLATPAAAQGAGRTIDRGDAVVTGFPGIAPSAVPLAPGANPLDHFFINLEGPSAQVLSLRAFGAPPAGQVVSPGVKLQVKARQVGQVFAIALDDGRGGGVASAYLGASSAYGLHIVDPNGAGAGMPKRLKNGKPGAQWMKGMFGTDAGGGPGAIWRVDGATGAVTLVANLPANSGPGIGDIVVDNANGQLFVSDLDNGLVHRVRLDGTVLDTFDHGMTGRPAKGLGIVVDDGKKADINDAAFDTTNPATWGATQAERQVWGMALHEGRLYYAVTGGQQIWSVGIAADGRFAGDARWELDVEGLTSAGPITDMLFDADGRLYLSQRGPARGSYDYSLYAEPGKSTVVRYRRESPDNPATASVWSPERDEYAVGLQAEHRFSAGGIALGYRHDEQGSLRAGTCGTTLWSTGDRLAKSGAPGSDGQPGFDIHGLQGHDVSLTRPDHVPPTRSYFADYDQFLGDPEKAGHVGDVEIFQPCGGPDFAEGGDGGYLPPGYWPPGGSAPPEFPPPQYPFNTNLELTKHAVGNCVPWLGGWACRYDIRIRNTGPDIYWAPIVVRDWLPANPAGAVMGFASTPPWACWNAGPASYGCWRPATFLAPGASVWLTAFAWVPNSYPHCHLQNVARIDWAPGGSPWNTNPVDDLDDATSLIPAAHCPPPGGNTNLRLNKKADPDTCMKWGIGYVCRYVVTVTNTGPGIYNDAIVVRDEPPLGTTAVFGPAASWNCVAAGGGYDCTHPPIALLPAQQVDLVAAVMVSEQQAVANACKIDNTARILHAPGGSPKNTNPGDDAETASALVPLPHACVQPVPLQQQQTGCPAGFKMKDGTCVPSSSLTPPLVPVPPSRPKYCPEGTVGTYPDCRKPEKPDKPDRPDKPDKPDRPVPEKHCPPGTIGKYPNCRTVEIPRFCPPGTIGKYPNCRTVEIPKRCPEGTTGRYPDCRKIETPKVCPQGTIGKYPNCRKVERPKFCPPGTIGKYPNCVKVPKLDTKPKRTETPSRQPGPTTIRKIN